MKVSDKLESLRKLMKEKNIDAYIIPSFDAHQSEYVAEHWKSRQWISGFTGSAGNVVVTMEEAGLWTDGRYYIQAENQLDGSGIKLFRAADPGVLSFTEWLKDNLKEESVVGFDGSVIAVTMLKDMEDEFSSKKISIKMEEDLIDMLWEDRPEIPRSNVFVHDVKFAGKSRSEKLEEVRKEMKAKELDYYLLTSLDDIAWLLNIRGNDVPNNPVVIANVVVANEKTYLFVNASKVSREVKEELEAEKVYLKEYEEIQEFLYGIKAEETVSFDPKKTSAKLLSALNNSVKKVEADNVTTKLKAIKNETEIENLKNCEKKDGVAMVKFIKWLKESVKSEDITEISAADKLEALRREQELCVGTSFDTIAGYKDHAAMMHYKATEETQYTLKDEGFFLVDSGGQYYDGTTDTTRTIVLGKLTEEEKRDFTLVLKGHIALSSAKFLEGTTGANLDILARQPIWNYGLDYKCGTGHGVGFFLNVHEGPQGIRRELNPVKLEPGMILTNEPGIYKEGKHGIRTENMMLVVPAEETEFGKFMRFEWITYCPIDLQGIDVKLLTEAEKEWLNSYHKDVYEKLTPYLNEEEKVWLKEATRRI